MLARSARKRGPQAPPGADFHRVEQAGVRPARRRHDDFGRNMVTSQPGVWRRQ